MLSPVRRLLKVFHPEGIPWPGTVFYNIISKSNIFQKSYELVVRDILDYCSEGSILDVGTGPGWLLIKFHQMSPGLKLTGVDTSPAMVAKAEENIAKARLSHAITIKEARADRMPFPEESFDLVVVRARCITGKILRQD